MKHHSFTLIELLVVIGIVVILSIGTIIGVSTARTKKSAKASADRIKSFLMDARSMAMMPSDTDLTTIHIEVKVYPFNSTETVKQNTIEIWRDPSFSSPDPEDELISTLKIPGGTIIDMAGTNPDNCIGGNPEWGYMYCYPRDGKACLLTCRISNTTIDYYYYYYDATNSSTIGDTRSLSNEHEPLKMNVTENGNADFSKPFYQIIIDEYTGVVKICYRSQGEEICY